MKFDKGMFLSFIYLFWFSLYDFTSLDRMLNNVIEEDV